MLNDFNIPISIEVLIKLTKIEKKGEYCFSDIERFLGYNTPRADVRRVLTTLINEKVMTLIEKRFGINIYKININALEDFINNLSGIKLLISYFEDNYALVI